MSDTEEKSEQKRRSIKIPVPWSSNPIEIRGYDFILILLVAAVPFGAYFLYELKTDSNTAHTKIFEALEVHTYVLSLPQDKRDALNISMPDSLRKKVRNRNSFHKED